MIEQKDNYDEHKEAKEIISRVPESREINAQFEKIEYEYENKPYDDKYYKSFIEKRVFFF